MSIWLVLVGEVYFVETSSWLRAKIRKTSRQTTAKPQIRCLGLEEATKMAELQVLWVEIPYSTASIDIPQSLFFTLTRIIQGTGHQNNSL